MNKVNTIAIDLAKNVFQICILSPDHKVVKNKQVSRVQLPTILMKQEKSIVVMEACYSSHYWARLFAAMGHDVRIIPAQHVKPFVRGNKNDHNDALAIAEASLRPNINFVPLKTIEQQDIQALHRIRDKLISRRTSIVNQARGLLSEYGIIMPKGLSGFTKNLTLLLDPADTRLTSRIKRQLAEVKEEYDNLSRRRLSIQKELDEYVLENELCQRLMTIPGIGIINSTALFAAIGNASQFANPRELSVWLGVTPKQYASGGKSYMGRMSKRGNQYLRKQLIHGARTLIHRTKGKNDKLSVWVKQLIDRTKGKNDKLSVWVKQLIDRRGKHKGVVAIANRLARLAWILLRRNEDYKAVSA